MIGALLGRLAGSGLSKAAMQAQAKAQAAAQAAAQAQSAAQARGSIGKPPPLPWEKQAANAKKLKEQADKITAAYQQQQQATDRLIARTYMATNVISQLGSTLSGSFVRGLTAGASAIQGIANPIKDLVSLSNPASVEAFVRTSNDAFAVMGRVARPVLDALTRSMQRMGDFYARIEPMLSPAASKIGDTLERMMTRMLVAAEPNLPVIELMAAVMLTVADAAATAANAILWLTERLGQLAVIRNLARLLGFDASSAKAGASSRGASVREVRTTTNAESISRQAIEQAYKQAMATPAAGPTEKDIPNLLGGIGSVMKELLDYLKGQLPNILTKADVEQLLASLPEMLAKAALNASPIGSAIATGKQLANGERGGIGSVLATVSPAVQLVGLLRSAMTR